MSGDRDHEKIRIVPHVRWTDIAGRRPLPDPLGVREGIVRLLLGVNPLAGRTVDERERE